VAAVLPWGEAGGRRSSLAGGWRRRSGQGTLVRGEIPFSFLVFYFGTFTCFLFLTQVYIFYMNFFYCRNHKINLSFRNDIVWDPLEQEKQAKTNTTTMIKYLH
jgi:hypothetical protein